MTTKTALPWQKRITLSLILGIVATLLIAYTPPASQPRQLVNSTQEQHLDQLIVENMQLGDIPGLSVLVIEAGEVTYQKGFGQADQAAGIPVTSNTLFELGSNSKAFTGLAIQLLAQRGDIHLDDPVTQYIPWLQPTYQGQPQTITLADILYHTSGVPFTSINHIPITDDPDSIEQTVQTLLDQALNRQPGGQFEYATINYDILGLVIETVTGRSYEEFIQTDILIPLNLKAYLCQSSASLQPSRDGHWLQSRVLNTTSLCRSPLPRQYPRRLPHCQYPRYSNLAQDAARQQPSPRPLQ